jgi:hypothetical protein
MTRKPLTTNEWITITISSFALIISFLTLYLDNRVENKLEARVIDANVNLDTKNGYNRDTAIISVAYSNVGNRQAVLLLPWYQQADTPAMAHGSNNWEFSNKEQFPIQLQPHESRLVQLKIPLSDIMLNPVKPHRTKSFDTVYTSYLRLEFVALNSYLKADSAFSDFDIELINNKKDFKSILMNKDPIHPTVIFQ